jgi:hypothetical protein
VRVNYIARWNGSSWAALGSGMIWSVRALALSGNGDVYAGGDFTRAGDKYASYFALWHPPGQDTPTPSVLATATATPPPAPTINATATTTATPTGTATPTRTACPIQFTDVPADSTFYPFIQCLACRGLLGGYADGTFRPGNAVTRGQLAKLVANAAGWTEPVTGPTFSDVAPGSTFYAYVERAAAHGAVGGYADGTFRPGNTATRGQTAKIVSNAFFAGCPMP